MAERYVDLSDPTAHVWETNSLQDHVGLIADQFRKSVRDPETHALAHKIVAGHVDRVVNGTPTIRAWGLDLLTSNAAPVPGEDDLCAINRIWNFYVMNVAYVPDPPDYDLFCTVKKTLEARVGDCDDATITIGALLRCAGFANVRARVISTNGRTWCHIYPVVSVNRSGSGRLIALDPTVKGSTPGWEYAKSQRTRDFMF